MTEDEYEDRVATLRTGIKMVLQHLEPSLLTPEQTIEIARQSLETLLESDLDKALAPSR